MPEEGVDIYKLLQAKFRIRYPIWSKFPREVWPPHEIKVFYVPLMVPVTFDLWRIARGYDENFYQYKLAQALCEEVFRRGSHESFEALMVFFFGSIPYYNLNL